MSRYEAVKESLRTRPRAWLVTGAAGFIGSNLVECLLELGQRVVGLDNFATGHPSNLEDILARMGADDARRFRFVEGDIRELDACRDVCRGVDFVLHQAALGSVPRSLEDPIATNLSNVDALLNMLVAARDEGVERFVYATSSSVYGDDRGLPKVEERLGSPLSPYAVSKYAGELYAEVFQRAYELPATGLRYFNVFGRRQDPAGAYAAVIPRWIGSLLAGETCCIYGDGETSRDFCYVENALQANLLAALSPADGDEHDVYNVACGDRTTLNELFRAIRDRVATYIPEAVGVRPVYKSFRPGDVRHSEADIGKIRRRLGYEWTHSVGDGLDTSIPWYVERLAGAKSSTPAVP